MATSCGRFCGGVDWELLRGLSEDDVRRVLSHARRRRFRSGEVIFHDGDPASSVHLMARGRVILRVTTPLGDVAALDIAVSGDVLGEMALLSPDGVRTATATALEPSETLSIDQAAFAELRHERPAVTGVLEQLLVARVRRLTDRLVEALYVPADVRVVRRLLELTDIYAGPIPLTQEDLAGLAGATRATVNRILRREEDKGTVELGRRRVTVIDRQSLLRRAR